MEITPEPSREEREAIVVAIEAVLAEGRDSPNAWWAAGVLDNLEHQEDGLEPA